MCNLTWLIKRVNFSFDLHITQLLQCTYTHINYDLLTSDFLNVYILCISLWLTLYIIMNATCWQNACWILSNTIVSCHHRCRFHLCFCSSIPHSSCSRRKKRNFFHVSFFHSSYFEKLETEMLTIRKTKHIALEYIFSYSPVMSEYIYIV